MDDKFVGGAEEAIAMMGLTVAERRKFAEWLRQDAENDLILVKQMHAIGLPGSVAKHRMALALSKQLVAKYLSEFEEVTIDAPKG